MIICGYKKINNIVSLIFLFIGFTSINAQEKNISNQAVIENGLQSTLDSTIRSTFKKGDDLIIHFNHVSDEKISFLNTFFIKYFSKKGLIVKKDSANYKLEIEQFSINITYKESSASLWGTGDNAQRNVSIKMTGWIEENINKKYIPFNVDRIVKDEMSIHNIREIETSPYTFTTGQVFKKSSWANYVEPFVVSVTAATVILLFFVLRT